MAIQYCNYDIKGTLAVADTSTFSKQLTVSSSVGGDSSWDDSGILIENTSTSTGEPTLAFRNAGTSGTGSAYWFTGLNQNTPYKIAYGTGFTDGNVKFEINTGGALKLPSYGAGTLVSDASGNITVSSGGGAGGPYLPLSAGSSYPLTSDLYMPGFIYHVGDTDSYFGFGSANVFDLATGGSRKLYADNTALYLYHSGSQKLKTTSTGVTVTGNANATGDLLLTTAGSKVQITGSGFVGADDNLFLGTATSGTDHTYKIGRASCRERV